MADGHVFCSIYKLGAIYPSFVFKVDAKIPNHADTFFSKDLHSMTAHDYHFNACQIPRNKPANFVFKIFGEFLPSSS